MRLPLLILSLAAAAAAAASDADTTIVSRLTEGCDPLLRVPSMSFDNPALMPFAADVSLSAAGAAARFTARSGDPQCGTGSDTWGVGAATYIHSGRLTLWGDAGYSSGRTRNVVYNETADIDIIYPYLTADTVGGDIDSERYSLSGGCAMTGSAWGWGVTARYTAAQHYRNVDPRPRNITGLLDISAGISRAAWGRYMAAVSLSLRRYTQSSDINFKSETGVEKVYHLTGLGNHYARFTGLGLSAHYSGYRYGVSANLFPRDRRGLAVSASLSRFTFDKVLRDLNELPLASVRHDLWRAQAAWLAPADDIDCAVSANYSGYSRRGTENVFGDASSNIYPQIGALDRYTDRRHEASVSALVSRHTRQWRLWAEATGGYVSRREEYAVPFTGRVSRGACGRAAAGYARMARRWLWRADASLLVARGQSLGCTVGASADFALSSSKALGLAAKYSDFSGLRSLDVSLSLSF